MNRPITAKIRCWDAMEGDILEKASYGGHLIAPLIKLVCVYPLGYSVQFTCSH